VCHNELEAPVFIWEIIRMVVDYIENFIARSSKPTLIIFTLSYRSAGVKYSQKIEPRLCFDI